MISQTLNCNNYCINISLFILCNIWSLYTLYISPLQKWDAGRFNVSHFCWDTEELLLLSRLNGNKLYKMHLRIKTCNCLLLYNSYLYQSAVSWTQNALTSYSVYWIHWKLPLCRYYVKKLVWGSNFELFVVNNITRHWHFIIIILFYREKDLVTGYKWYCAISKLIFIQFITLYPTSYRENYIILFPGTSGL